MKIIKMFALNNPPCIFRQFDTKSKQASKQTNKQTDKKKGTIKKKLRALAMQYR